MQSTTLQPVSKPISKGAFWGGWIISIICILFLLFDGITKAIKEHHTIEASSKMGWPVETLQPMGIVLLLITILYAIPRTAVLGAILVTAWLGGATAELVRIGYPLWFSVTFGILVWLGLWLRDIRTRRLLQ